MACFLRADGLAHIAALAEMEPSTGVQYIFRTEPLVKASYYETHLGGFSDTRLRPGTGLAADQH